MGTKTAISWTDATWNIARGCTKVDEDCKYCYMYRDSLNGTRHDPKKVEQTKTVFNLPMKIKEASLIFTSSLTDVFHEDIDSFRHLMWDIIRQCPHHTFQLLTKRPERIKQCLPDDWAEGYDNVWIGTSVGSSESLHRIAELIKLKPIIPVTFLSLEPLWGEIRLLHRLLPVNSEGFLHSKKKLDQMKEDYPKLGMVPPVQPIDWVIVGGESGNETGMYKYRPCKLEWIERIVNDCKEAGVPVFVKQLGTHLSKELKLKDRHGTNIEEFPEHLRVQEMPVYKTQQEPIRLRKQGSGDFRPGIDSQEDFTPY